MLSISIAVPQIKGLDQELIKYRNALKKAKGPTAANIKRRAMETLKRKKMYEGQRDQMAGQQFNIEQTSFAIDSIKDTATTVSQDPLFRQVPFRQPIGSNWFSKNLSLVESTLRFRQGVQPSRVDHAKFFTSSAQVHDFVFCHGGQFF